MNEETFKKILYLIFKVIIKNNGFLSQLEIFRDVRYLMNNYFSIKECDLIVKIGQGKSEDFKDILNFILTILCELALVSQKMENKSFYFKWNGFKGFRKKYLLEFINHEIKFEMSESFEHRLQIYTRLLILTLIEKKDLGITLEASEQLLKNCGLENQQRHIEKIHWILRFIEFVVKESPPTPSHQIFALHTKENPQFEVKKGDQVIFKINKNIIEESLIKDSHVAEKFYQSFISNIISKYMLWNDEVLVAPNVNKMEVDSEIGNAVGIYKILIQA